MLKEKLNEIKLELAKEYLKKGKTTPAMKLIKDLIFEISHLKIKEQIEVLNKLLNADINRKSYEYFFYRYIKPYINADAQTIENSANNALAREKNPSTPLKSQNNDKKLAPNPNDNPSETQPEKEVKNEKNITEKLKHLKQTDFNYDNNNDMKNLV